MATAAASGPRHHTRIVPGSTWSLPLHEVWRYRGLLWTLGGRDVKIRYKQTVLGVTWVVLQPLLAAGLFTFIFGTVADLPIENGVPYFLASFAGFQAYFLFSSTVNKASISLIGNAHLVTKIYFPRLILPMSSIPTTLIDFTVAMAMLSILMALWGQVPGAALLLAPLWVAGLIGLGLGLGLIAAGLAVHYRDVRYVVPVIVQFFVYAAPVGYTVTALSERIDARWMLHLYLLNPMAPLIEGLRWSLLGTNPPPIGYTVLALTMAAASMIVGSMWFTRMERTLPDVI